MSNDRDPDLDLRIGHDELVIHQRYEAASIANDVGIGLWFLIGSVLFFSETTATVATALFVIGSVQMLIRPVIRLGRKFHLQRLRGGSGGTPRSTDDPTF